MRKVGYIAVLALVTAGGPIYAQSKPTAAAGASDPDKIVCKRFGVTGSLAQKRKVCKTKAQWLRSQSEAREAGDKWQGKLCTSPECVGG